jgi:hypothetical protein
MIISEERKNPPDSFYRGSYLSFSGLVVFLAGFEVFFCDFSSWLWAAGGLARGAAVSSRASGLGAEAVGAGFGRLTTGAAGAA